MTLIYFIFILGIIIFVHELGHFIFSKLFKVHVYEFSIGMGPRLFLKKRKNDETEYSIRALPIGGYVRMAGEDNEVDKDVKDENRLTSKPWIQRFIILVAGSTFNFILAFIIILTLALANGYTSLKPYVGELIKDFPITNSGIKQGDLIISVDNKKVSSYEELSIRLYGKTEATTFEVKNSNSEITKYEITPILIDGGYYFGITQNTNKEYGIINSIQYSFYKINSIIKSMFLSISSLITGTIPIDKFSGPVGVYDMVGSEVALGASNIAYFIAYLCINIGFINLLPIPALDGGRIFFLIIEKIKGSKLNPNIENTINVIGFLLLMLLMIIVTFNDVFRLGG